MHQAETINPFHISQSGVMTFMKSGPWFAQTSMFCAISKWCCCYCSSSNLGEISTNLHMHKSAIKMECTVPCLFPVISWILTGQFSMSICRTFPIDPTFQLVDDLPDCASLSIEVWPCLKQLYHSSSWVLSMAPSPKPATSSECLKPDYHQNLVLYLCLIFSMKTHQFSENLVKNLTSSDYPSLL